MNLASDGTEAPVLELVTCCTMGPKTDPTNFANLVNLQRLSYTSYMLELNFLGLNFFSLVKLEFYTAVKEPHFSLSAGEAACNPIRSWGQPPQRNKDSPFLANLVSRRNFHTKTMENLSLYMKGTTTKII